MARPVDIDVGLESFDRRPLIDLATAAVIAHDRATEQKRFVSIYETRGVLMLGGR